MVIFFDLFLLATGLYMAVLDRWEWAFFCLAFAIAVEYVLGDDWK